MKTMKLTAQFETVTEYLDHWAKQHPDRIWLRDLPRDTAREWSWRRARAEIHAVAAWLEQHAGEKGDRIALLSRNRAHWMLADMAIVASGRVSVPLFTTQTAESSSYVMDFSEARVLIVGEAENWEKLRPELAAHTRVIAMPGVEPGLDCDRWEDIVAQHGGDHPAHQCSADDLLSLVFTSGTTGVPKGVMQTHASMLIPMQRVGRSFNVRHHCRFLSYLPLAHVGERQLVWIQSLVNCGEVTFNDAMPNLVRNMAEFEPNFFFGAPRVWEQLQLGIIGMFGTLADFESAFAADPGSVSNRVRTMLGLQDTDYLLSAAAPIPKSLLEWYAKLGLDVLEGFGQTEAMAMIAGLRHDHRAGSIGKPLPGVETRILESGELVCRADGLSPGYYKMPEKTAETFVDGWVHTGDKARVDKDGYYYITGRVKDYFKTIHGKFVAPAPIEGEFARSPFVEQQCLLGRGFSKTVMVCVLTAAAQAMPEGEVDDALEALVQEVNVGVEKHARIGAVIVAIEPWTIENGVLTPTLKIRREEIEQRFSDLAEELARESARQRRVLVHRQKPAW